MRRITEGAIKVFLGTILVLAWVFVFLLLPQIIFHIPA